MAKNKVVPFRFGTDGTKRNLFHFMLDSRGKNFLTVFDDVNSKIHRYEISVDELIESGALDMEKLSLAIDKHADKWEPL